MFWKTPSNDLSIVTSERPTNATHGQGSMENTVTSSSVSSVDLAKCDDPNIDGQSCDFCLSINHIDQECSSEISPGSISNAVVDPPILHLLEPKPVYIHDGVSDQRSYEIPLTAHSKLAVFDDSDH